MASSTTRPVGESRGATPSPVRRRAADTPAAPTAPAGGPAAVPAPPLKLRRRPMLLALGVALVCLGGLAAAWLTTTAGDTSSVLALRSTVDRGTVLAADDLIVARINADPALRTVPAGEQDQVIGQRAAVDLAAGSLLTPDSTTQDITPATGQSLVGVTVTAAQLPAHGLRPGDIVRIVATPRAQDDPPTTSPATFSATVVGVRDLPDAGLVVVDVTVPSADASDLAAQVATGRIALVLDSGTS